MKKLRDASPQAVHHFTRFDQVNQLVEAGEADPDMGFMARLLALCCLPRANPGNRHQYKRVNGPFKLIMVAGADNKLPFGNLPRLLLAWVCTEAVRTQSRELVLGKSLSEFMRTLGVYSSSGGNPQTRLRNQMKRLFGCTVSLIYENNSRGSPGNFAGSRPHEFWWNEGKPNESGRCGTARSALVRKFLSGDHPPPGTARHEHPQGAQTLSPWDSISTSGWSTGPSR